PVPSTDPEGGFSSPIPPPALGVFVSPRPFIRSCAPALPWLVSPGPAAVKPIHHRNNTARAINVNGVFMSFSFLRCLMPTMEFKSLQSLQGADHAWRKSEVGHILPGVSDTQENVLHAGGVFCDGSLFAGQQTFNSSAEV
ncbi:MAG: hypothetical protein ACREJU_05875, partial [Nitrospiraceae bacterium]